MQRRDFLARLAAIPLPALRAADPPFRVIAHRGEHLSRPENTIPAVEEAIRLGCDFVEIDVRTTRDGALVLMHNATVDATTNGKGAVAEMSLSEIRALDAGVRWPKFGGTRVPVFDELLEAARGKIGLYVDSKAVSARDLSAALRRHKMVEASVIYASPRLLAELLAIEPAIRPMPEAVSVEQVKKLAAELHPKVFAFDRRDFQDPVIAAAKSAGAGVFVDRLGPDDNEDSWRDALRRGATGIQTDHPERLIALRANLRP